MSQTHYVKAFVAAAASQTLNISANWLTLTPTADCFIDLTTTAAASTGYLLKANLTVVMPVDRPTTLSVIRSSGDGNLHITETSDHR